MNTQPTIPQYTWYIPETVVPGRPILSRVNIEVEVESSNVTRDSFLQIDRPKAREREMAEFDAIDEHRKLKSGNTEPNCEITREDTRTTTTACQKVAEGKTSFELSWRIKVAMKKKEKKRWHHTVYNV